MRWDVAENLFLRNHYTAPLLQLHPCPRLRLRAAPMCLPVIVQAQNRLPSHDPSKHKPLETDMINNAKFRIIGRIGSITATDKVTHISIALDRQVKDGTE